MGIYVSLIKLKNLEPPKPPGPPLPFQSKKGRGFQQWAYTYIIPSSCVAHDQEAADLID